MTRQELLRSLFDNGGAGLEIGPSYNPLAPKAEGFNVEIVDHLDRAGLIAKYGGDPNVASTEVIEEVDYVFDGRPLTELIGKRACYDFIVASHVIEHVPNFMGFLRDCEGLLKPGGVVVLAIPDKRYCFDLFQPISTVGQILQTDLDRRARPTAGSIFDQRAYMTNKDGAIVWLDSDT